jgi:hypothetical protein
MKAIVSRRDHLTLRYATAGNIYRAIESEASCRREEAKREAWRKMGGECGCLYGPEYATYRREVDAAYAEYDRVTAPYFAEFIAARRELFPES